MCQLSYRNTMSCIGPVAYIFGVLGVGKLSLDLVFEDLKIVNSFREDGIPDQQPKKCFLVVQLSAKDPPRYLAALGDHNHSRPGC